MVDVAGVERCHADATRIDAVDAELVAQSFHLRLAQARVAEHAALAGDETEILLLAIGCQPGVELVEQERAHLLDALAHRGELLLPLRAQRRGVEHGGHHLRAVGRRVAVVGTDCHFELRQHPGGLVGVGADHVERADPLAVEREAFGEGGRDEEVQPRCDELLHHRAVLLDAVAKSLVGQVEKRHQTA